MINIKKITDKNKEQYFNFLEQNESNLNCYYKNSDSNDKNNFNGAFNYFLIYSDDECIGYLKTYFSNLVIKDIELKCGGISYFSLLENKAKKYMGDILNEIDELLEDEKYNITFLNKYSDSYRKFDYWPIGTIKNFTITKQNILRIVSKKEDYVVKCADENDIELLNEFYKSNSYYIDRNNNDWQYLLKHSNFKYYIATNGEDISYLTYCPKTQSIFEAHGDITCLNMTSKYIFELFDCTVLNVHYNGLDFDITTFLYENCKEINLSSIANMRIYNGSDTLEKLNALITAQGYEFNNLNTEDEKELCIRLLGFEYSPLNKYQFVKPSNISFSIADLK